VVIYWLLYEETNSIYRSYHEETLLKSNFRTEHKRCRPLWLYALQKSTPSSEQIH